MKKKNALMMFALAFLLASGCRKAPEPVIPAYPKKSVEIIAPSGPGSGYDLTVRSLAQCLKDTRLVQVPLPATNKAGGGGVLALEYLEQNRGADDILAVYSPPLCLIHLNGSTPLDYSNNTTPVAMLITDYGLFAVGKDSPYGTIHEVMEALKQDPKSVRVGGISARMSMDHVQFLKIAKAAGVNRLDEIEYIGFQDGTAAAQLMGGHVDLISTGISDSIGLVESGDIRALAITADQRVGSGIVAEVPTCIEQGINATFFNWRGVFGPRDMPQYAVDYWEGTLQELAGTEEWRQLCGRFGWDMTYLGRKEFVDFLAGMDEEYRQLLREVALSP